MKFITIEQAQQHCKTDGEDDDQLGLYADAAEAACARHCNRSVFASQSELDAAIDGLPARVQAAKTTYDTAVVAADEISDMDMRRYAVANADFAFRRRLQEINRDRVGIVADKDFVAAALLLTGNFYREREIGGLTPQIERILTPMIWYGE